MERRLLDTRVNVVTPPKQQEAKAVIGGLPVGDELGRQAVNVSEGGCSLFSWRGFTTGGALGLHAELAPQLRGHGLVAFYADPELDLLVGRGGGSSPD